MGFGVPITLAWAWSMFFAARVIINPIFPVVWVLSVVGICALDFPPANRGIKTTLWLVIIAPLISLTYIIFAYNVLPMCFRLICMPTYERRRREQQIRKRRDDELRNAARAKEETEREAMREAALARDAAEREAERVAAENAKRREKELWGQIMWDVKRMQDERERTGTYFLIQSEGN